MMQESLLASEVGQATSILLSLLDSDPARVRVVEDEFLRRIGLPDPPILTDDPETAATAADARAAILETALAVPGELRGVFCPRPLLATRAILLAYVHAYFSRAALLEYYAHVVEVVCAGHHPEAARRRFVDELVYMLLLRIDASARPVIAAAAGRAGAFNARVEEAHATYAELRAAGVLGARWAPGGAAREADEPPARVPWGEPDDDDDGGAEPARIGAWRAAKRRRVEAEVRLPQRRGPGRAARGYLHALVAGAAAVQSALPRFLLVPRAEDTMDVLMEMILRIPALLRHAGALYYEVVPLYCVLSITRMDLDPCTPRGMYGYLQFFTLTHLSLCLADVDAREAAAEVGGGGPEAGV